MRARAVSEDNLEPGRPEQRERSSFNRRWILGDAADAELREFYLDGQVGRTFLRIGKQQIVWGQADGLRVLDVVNPFSSVKVEARSSAPPPVSDAVTGIPGYGSSFTSVTRKRTGWASGRSAAACCLSPDARTRRSDSGKDT